MDMADRLIQLVELGKVIILKMILDQLNMSQRMIPTTSLMKGLTLPNTLLKNEIYHVLFPN